MLIENIPDKTAKINQFSNLSCISIMHANDNLQEFNSNRTCSSASYEWGCGNCKDEGLSRHTLRHVAVKPQGNDSRPRQDIFNLRHTINEKLHLLLLASLQPYSIISTRQTASLLVLYTDKKLHKNGIPI